jgi:putative redox protein
MPKNVDRITAISQGMQTHARIKNHEIIIDTTPAFGGKETGPDPLSLLLSALAGCENIMANIVAKEINFDLQGIEFDIRGEFDPRGLMGDPNVRPYFEKVTVHAKVKTSESEDRIKELQEITDSRCPVYTTLKAAGVELEVNWVKA